MQFSLCPLMPIPFHIHHSYFNTYLLHYWCFTSVIPFPWTGISSIKLLPQWVNVSYMYSPATTPFGLQQLLIPPTTLRSSSSMSATLHYFWWWLCRHPSCLCHLWPLDFKVTGDYVDTSHVYVIVEPGLHLNDLLTMSSFLLHCPYIYDIHLNDLLTMSALCSIFSFTVNVNGLFSMSHTTLVVFYLSSLIGLYGCTNATYSSMLNIWASAARTRWLFCPLWMGERMQHPLCSYYQWCGVRQHYYSADSTVDVKLKSLLLCSFGL